MRSALVSEGEKFESVISLYCAPGIVTRKPDLEEIGGSDTLDSITSCEESWLSESVLLVSTTIQNTQTKCKIF